MMDRLSPGAFFKGGQHLETRWQAIMRSIYIVLAAILLSAGTLFVGAMPPVMAAPAAEIVHGEQPAQRTGRTSRASIQRSPSRRALKVVSVGVGGGAGLATECDELSNMMAEGEFPGSGGLPQSAHRVVYPYASTATVSGFVIVILTQTFICVDPAIPSTGAVAVYAMDGTELPAAGAESEAELEVVSMPAAAYLRPGYWTLIANDGQHATMTGLWVPELEGPAAVYDGDTMLLAGFQPNERIAIAWFDYDDETKPDQVVDVDELASEQGMTDEDLLMVSSVFAASHVATLQADEQGALVIDWPDEFQQDFVVAGERTPDLVTSWYGTVRAGDSTGEIDLDYATLAAADTDAGVDGFAPGDRVRNVSSGLIMVRRTPGYLNKPAGDTVRRVRAGEEMEITGPGVVADDLTWWPVRYVSTTGAQVDGWVAEVAPDGDLLLGVVE